jgi:hypothetical protein
MAKAGKATMVNIISSTSWWNKDAINLEEAKL